MDLELAGKTALITGASKGIGRGVADILAAEGCNVHLVARDGDALAKAAEDITADHGVSVEVTALDLSAERAATDLVASIPVPDILVNNAGAIPAGDILSVDESTWRAAWDLKVFGYINLCRAMYGTMAERGQGVICNVTGLAADKTDYNYIAGTAGNASLNAFTRALGGVSIEKGVRVLAVSPGPVKTERLIGLLKTRAAADGNDPEAWEDYMSGMPLGRAAEVREVADLVAFAVSARASYLSGTVITIDGGMGSRGGSFAK